MLLKLWERPAPKDCLSWRVDSLFDLVKTDPTPTPSTPKTMNLRLQSTHDTKSDSQDNPPASSN